MQASARRRLADSRIGFGLLAVAALGNKATAGRLISRSVKPHLDASCLPMILQELRC